MVLLGKCQAHKIRHTGLERPFFCRGLLRVSCFFSFFSWPSESIPKHVFEHVSKNSFGFRAPGLAKSGPSHREVRFSPIFVQIRALGATFVADFGFFLFKGETHRLSSGLWPRLQRPHQITLNILDHC